MTVVTLRTSTKLPAAQVAELTLQLKQAHQQVDGTEFVFDIIYEISAPQLSTYAEVGRALLQPSPRPGSCYRAYLACLADGIVPEDIAYAAYLACKVSWPAP